MEYCKAFSQTAFNDNHNSKNSFLVKRTPTTVCPATLQTCHSVILGQDAAGMKGSNVYIAGSSPGTHGSLHTKFPTVIMMQASLALSYCACKGAMLTSNMHTCVYTHNHQQTNRVRSLFTCHYRPGQTTLGFRLSILD